MKIIHIIPSAFHYFDDIRVKAFRLVDELNKQGVETEAITIQFGVAKPGAEEGPGRVAAGGPEPEAEKRRYLGVTSVGEAVGDLETFDIVHVHTPLFGAAGHVIKWKNKFPNKPLVVTYYRRVRTPDFFSLAIVIYNFFYLPRLFSRADVVAVGAVSAIPWSLRPRVKKNVIIDESVKFGSLDLTEREGGINFTTSERIALKYLVVYNKLVNIPKSF